MRFRQSLPRHIQVWNHQIRSYIKQSSLFTACLTGRIKASPRNRRRSLKRQTKYLSAAEKDEALFRRHPDSQSLIPFKKM
jgi:hypothetical protein